MPHKLRLVLNLSLMRPLFSDCIIKKSKFIDFQAYIKNDGTLTGRLEKIVQMLESRSVDKKDLEEIQLK